MDKKSKYMLRKEYEEYLKSEQWREKRQHIAEIKKYTCEICKKVILKGFHIHHKTYERFMYELDSDLMFLCEDCHIDIHGKLSKKKKINKKKKQVKSCKNCYYSQIMTYSGQKKRKVRWCNYKYEQAKGTCCHYKRKRS